MDKSATSEPSTGSTQVIVSSDDIAKTAIYDVLRLFHWSIVLYCLPWLAYYIIVGLYPPFTGAQIILCVVGVEMFYFMYRVLRFKGVL